MKYALLLILLSAQLYADPKENFSAVQKVFESSCLKCHSDNNAAENGNLNMTTLPGMLKGGTMGPALTPGNGQSSLLYLLTTLAPGSREKSKVMPPAPFKPLSKADQQIIKKWIDAGAYWPKDEKLSYKPTTFESIPPTELYKTLFSKDTQKTEKFESYESIIPGSKITYSMAAIPAGSFLRQHEKQMTQKLIIDKFWMAKHEITWEEYDAFLFGTTQQSNQNQKSLEKVVSRPTPPYVDMSFGMGKKNRPAICITQLSAKAYCMWLSAKTGHFYRLPTEAEWEYACRAGSTTKYYWGDNIADYQEHEWFFENSDEMYQQVGSKKPNQFGLYDMLGNVSEWCLDAYRQDFYKNSPTKNPLSLPITSAAKNSAMEAPWPTQLYGRIVKGGNYQDDSTDVSISRRLLSNENWKLHDPQLPKSVWWMTNSLHVGFRIVRTTKVPPLKELHKYWPSDEEFKAIPKR